MGFIFQLSFICSRTILQGLAKDLDLTDSDIDELLHEVDSDGNGEISFHGEVNSSIQQRSNRV